RLEDDRPIDPLAPIRDRPAVPVPFTCTSRAFMPSGESKQPSARAAAEIGPDAVAAYLRRQPEFLAQNPELLVGTLAAAPRRGGGSYDFQSFLVHKLRHDVDVARAANRALIGTTR